MRAGLTPTGPGGGLRPVGGGVCRAGERLALTSAGAWRENRTLQTAGGPRLSGALWVNFGRRRWGPGLGGALSGELPGAQPLLGAPRLRRESLGLRYSLTAPFLGTYSPLYAGNSGAL